VGSELSSSEASEAGVRALGSWEGAGLEGATEDIMSGSARGTGLWPGEAVMEKIVLEGLCFRVCVIVEV
jgi:hypothetical protein